MGTTYHAQVEVCFPPNEYRNTHVWQSVSRWELEKDYSFHMAWGEIATEGWPLDADLIINDDEMDVTFKYGMPNWHWDYEMKSHCDGELFAILEEQKSHAIGDDSFLKWSTWAKELQEHVKRLCEQGMKVRVLVWGV